MNDSHLPADGVEDAPGAFDPSSMAGNAPEGPSRLAWYRRPWVLAIAGVVVVVAASVIVDLPTHTSNTADAASETTLMKQINTDAAPCDYAVQESFTIYRQFRSGTLSAADRARVPQLLHDDQTACSFTSEPVFDLTNNFQTTGTAAGKYIGDVDNQVTLWITSDALAAIEDIQAVTERTGTNGTASDLVKQQHLLTVDRGNAIADLQAAERMLHAQLPAPDLPVLPRLPTG